MRKQLGLILLGLILLILVINATYVFAVSVLTQTSGGPGGQAGTTLSATVTASAYWKITYGWTIDKSVTPETWHLFEGDSGTSQFTITVTKDSGTEEAWVEGQVCVTNGGAVETENLAIKVVLKNGYAPPNDYLTEAPVDVSSHPVLAPGEIYCYSYRINIPITGGAYPQPHADGTYKVTAEVTITNHSGHLGEPFGPSPSETTIFPSQPTRVNDVIHVDDTNGGSWTFSESGSVTYEKTFTCADKGENVNTATIRETRQSDSATVTVICYALEVTKTAETSFTRTYIWTIDKKGDQTYLKLKTGETFDVNYEITVEATYTDSDWAVTGTITVYNPAPIPVTINTIADVVSGIEAKVDFGVTFPYTLEAEGTLTVTYSASLPDASTRINTATVTIQNYNYKLDGTKTEIGTTAFFGTANVDFTSATITEVDESIEVSDTYADSLGTVAYGEAPKTFTYTRTIGPYSVPDTYTVENTASFVAYGTGATGSDSWTVEVEVYQFQATISGVKFYDADVDGVLDPGEVGIAGWKIQLLKKIGDTWTLVGEVETDIAGGYSFTVDEAGTYRVVEVMPQGMWVQTAPVNGYYGIEVALGGTYTDNNFGNVCLKPGTGGKTLGFWSNKNGQALITSDDVSALNSLNLYQPSGWSYPSFSETLTTAKTQIRNYLLSATAADMRWMLSAQLIATKLNVLHSFLDNSTTVYVGPSLHVPSGFITIGEIIENAYNALLYLDRGAQEYWKNLLDGLNNNRLPFLCPEPCLPIVYP
ncbi:MAG: SdrD B-like domain-containing protein [Thermoproteota archaeon]